MFLIYQLRLFVDCPNRPCLYPLNFNCDGCFSDVLCAMKKGRQQRYTAPKSSSATYLQVCPAIDKFRSFVGVHKSHLPAQLIKTGVLLVKTGNFQSLLEISNV